DSRRQAAERRGGEDVCVAEDDVDGGTGAEVATGVDQLLELRPGAGMEGRGDQGQAPGEVVGMPVTDSFVAFVLEQLDSLGPITAKRMFGGVGLYAGDLFFAL